MAVIKSLDKLRRCINGTVSGDEQAMEEAIATIKVLKESEFSSGEVFFVGEKGGVEVDISKVGCPDCVRILQIDMSVGRRK